MAIRRRTDPARAAFDILDWEQAARWSRACARRWCRSHEDHEAIAQEALVRLVQHRDAVRCPESWLYVITRRLALESRARGESYGTGPENIRAVDHVGQRNAADEPAAAVRAIVRDRRLAVRDRRILAWVALGYTHAEIAVRLGCNRTAVGREISRAAARLEKLAAGAGLRRSA